jgi:hypothetical protein
LKSKVLLEGEIQMSFKLLTLQCAALLYPMAAMAADSQGGLQIRFNGRICRRAKTMEIMIET